MNNFVWPTHFACTQITNQTVFPNSYSLSICIEPISTKSNVNLGFKKLRYFVENHLHNSVFIYENSPIVDSILQLENSKVLFPVEPFDFSVASVLFCKIISITSKYFDIDYLTLDSVTGDHVQYTLSDPADAGLDLDGNNWWNTDSPCTDNTSVISWEELNLKNHSSFSPIVIKGGLDK